MTKVRINTISPDKSGAQRPSFFGRLRAQPGFRTASIAFVLTVVLGIGSTAAYAYWSQSATVNITATTRSNLPANTALVTAQPALATRPGTPSNGACKALLSKEEMVRTKQKHTDTRFSWQGAAKATSYVVTVRSNSSYVYQQTKTVAGPEAEFKFERSESHANGDQILANPAFYGLYTVRVMPMAGAVPGDPLYFTYQYGHQNSSNCHDGVRAEASLASPVGSVAPVECVAPTGPGSGEYSDLEVTWKSSVGATSYAVTMVNTGRSYGGEIAVTGTSASFRIVWPENDKAAYFAGYLVRVQPMKGTEAGDPTYRTYRLGQYDYGCDYGAPPSS